MVTLQVVSIYDMVCAAVFAVWVGSIGFLLVRTVSRAVNVWIGNRSNSSRVFQLEMEIEAAKLELAVLKRRKRRV